MVPAWDLACAYRAAFSVLAALDRRRRTSHGAELKLALSDVTFASLSYLGLIAEAEVLHQDRPSIGNHIYGAFGLDFGTADGYRIMLVGISAGQWKALMRATALEARMSELASRLGLDFLREADRYAAREPIATIIEQWCANRSLAQITHLLDEHKACWGQYRTARELVTDDPRVEESAEIFAPVDTPGVGRHRAAGTPTRASGELRGAMSAAPLIGQHTDQILLDVLGLDAAAIGRLHDSGLVARPQAAPIQASG